MVGIREKVCEKFQLTIKDVELSMGMSADYAEAVTIFYEKRIIQFYS